MKKIGILLLVSVLLGGSAGVFAAAKKIATTVASSPVGYWKTIDDVTSQPKSIVQIKENNQHELEGVVVKLFKGALQTCSACQGELKDKPILGMVVIRGLHQKTNSAHGWQGGSALDPKNGKTYHFIVTLSDDGQTLYARGYIGFPLFGRTQTWHRVSGPTAN